MSSFINSTTRPPVTQVTIDQPTTHSQWSVNTQSLRFYLLLRLDASHLRSFSRLSWLLTRCISFQSHTMSQIQTTWETQHQNTAEEPKDHLAAPRGSDRNTTNPTHASLQRNQGNHTFPQKHLSYCSETMVTGYGVRELGSWSKVQLIFSIGELVLNDNLKTFKERHSVLWGC